MISAVTNMLKTNYTISSTQRILGGYDQRSKCMSFSTRQASPWGGDSPRWSPAHSVSGCGQKACRPCPAGTASPTHHWSSCLPSLQRTPVRAPDSTTPLCTDWVLSILPWGWACKVQAMFGSQIHCREWANLFVWRVTWCYTQTPGIKACTTCHWH